LVVVNWSDWFWHSLTLDLIKSGLAPSHEYLCHFQDLWTGERLGSARDKVKISDVVPHGSYALRVKCIRQIMNDDDHLEEIYLNEPAYVPKDNQSPIEENIFFSS